MRMKRKYFNKVCISVLSTALIFSTTIATTFAWVGVLSNSTFDKFDISLQSSNLQEYGIEISTTGLPDTFGSTVNITDIKKQILLNWGYTDEQLSNDTAIESYFGGLNLDQCTNLPIVKSDYTGLKELGQFRLQDNTVETSSLFKFDLYISASKFYDSGSNSDYLLDVYLDTNALTGNIKKKVLTNAYRYPSSFVNPLSSENLPSNVRPLIADEYIKSTRVDSASASRLAFEKYEVVEKYHPEKYTSESKPVSSVIYQTFDENPYYDLANDIYTFGGMIEDDYNLAIQYYNSYEYKFAAWNQRSVSFYQDSYSEQILNVRGLKYGVDNSKTRDKLLTKETNHLVDSSNEDEHIGTATMMKVTVYFWFEGWDADCFPAINFSPVAINLTFKNDNED